MDGSLELLKKYSLPLKGLEWGLDNQSDPLSQRLNDCSLSVQFLMPICWESLKSLLSQAEPAAWSRCQGLPLPHPVPSFPPLPGSTQWPLVNQPYHGYVFKEVLWVELSPWLGKAWAPEKWDLSRSPHQSLSHRVMTPSQAHCFFSPCVDAYRSVVKWPGFAWSLHLLDHFWSSPERWSFLHIWCLTLQSDTGLGTWLPIQRPA